MEGKSSVSSYRRPTMTVAGKQVLVSRHVMERKLGRALLSTEIVHHRNGDPFDNQESNLQLVSRSEHKKIHDSVGAATRLKKIHRFDLDELMALYRRPMTFEEIARSKGCSEATVRRMLKPLLGIDKDLRVTRSRFKGRKYKGRNDDGKNLDGKAGRCFVSKDSRVPA